MTDETSGSVRYTFGPFSFSGASLTLTKDGEPIRLERKVREGLMFLLERAGETVTRDELLEGIWQTSHRTDQSIFTLIRKLREVVGAEAIVNVHGVGYRFVPPVTVEVEKRTPRQLTLQAGDKLKGRPHWVLIEPVVGGQHPDVWVAEHQKTHERRVFKFATDSDGLRHLKREVTLSRVIATRPELQDSFARVLDWQFDEPPFFIEMPYIGLDLLRWSAAGGLKQLTRPQRLDLFARLSESIGAAHALGVIHKDLKPANILVKETGQGPQLVIGDFGSGRLLDHAGLESLGITRIGFTQTGDASSLSGTPLYIAPELLTGEAPTTRADVYSLGVILFQLVIGDFRRPLIEGWQQRVDDPLLRGDIIAAVQDAPARRLGTATDLAERIRTLEERRQKRDLAELRAIEAEALRKRVERQKLLRPWQLSAALALSVGVVFSLFSAYNASVARAEAEREAETAVAVTEFLTNDVFGAIDPFVGQQVSAALKTLLSAGAERIESSLSSQPAVKAPLHRQIGLLYLRVGDYGLAKEQFQKAEALAGSEEDRIFALAGTLTAAAHSGQREEAAKLAAEIKDLLAANQKERSNVWTTVALASEAYFGGRIAEGEQIYRDYFATATLPDSRWPAELVVAKLNWIGMIFQMRQIDEALSQLLTLQAAVERGQIDNPVSLITIDYLTGRAQLARGEFDEAYLSLSRAEEKSLLSLDEGHPTRQGIYNDLGQVLADLGKYEEALGRLRRALDERLARYSPDHILPMHSRYAITLTELRSGSIERSLSEARATTAAASSLPVNHPLRQGAELLLAEVLLAAGRADEMEALLDKLPEAEISNGVPTLVLQARHKYLRSRLEHAKDDLESAVALAQESLSLAKAVLGSRHYWSVTIGQWANDLGVGDLD